MEKKTIKHPPMDLSRFSKCTIKTPAICDLLLIEEFKAAVDAYQGEIDDKWVIDLTFEIGSKLKSNSEIANQYIEAGRSDELTNRRIAYSRCKTKMKYFKKEYSVYADEAETRFRKEKGLQ